MEGCICHFVKWQIHPFISNETFRQGTLDLAVNMEVLCPIEKNIMRKGGTLLGLHLFRRGSGPGVVVKHVVCHAGAHELFARSDI